MRSPSPVLMPLARSNEQLLVLAEVFCGAPRDIGVTGVEIGRRTGISQPTISRELNRLERAGWIQLRQLGTVKIAEPVETLPIYLPVRQLVASTVGALPLLRDALANDERVSQAWIFGSWAARFHGEPGAFPNDIDLAIIGGLSLPDAYRLADDVQEQISVTIGIRIYPSGAESDFLDEIRLSGVTVKQATI